MCYKVFMIFSRNFFTQAENILLISPFYCKKLLLVSSLLLFSYFQHKHNGGKKGRERKAVWRQLHTTEMLYNLIKWWIKLKLAVRQNEKQFCLQFSERLWKSSQIYVLHAVCSLWIYTITKKVLWLRRMQWWAQPKILNNALNMTSPLKA